MPAPVDAKHVLTDAEIAAFVKKYYKHERLEGRDNPDTKDIWHDYSKSVISSRIAEMRANGYILISQHESNTGETIILNKFGEIAAPSLMTW